MKEAIFSPSRYRQQCAGAASKREGALKARSAFLERKLQEPLGLFFLSSKRASEPQDRCSGNKKKNAREYQISRHLHTACVASCRENQFEHLTQVTGQASWTGLGFKLVSPIFDTELARWMGPRRQCAHCSPNRPYTHTGSTDYATLIHLWGPGRKSCNQLQNLWGTSRDKTIGKGWE